MSSAKAKPRLTIVSGGQTGADRAGLDWAIAHGIPHGGWCPKGRRAEDGAIPAQYLLNETPSSTYIQRTEWNVRDSDGTVIFTMEERLVGGSLRTLQLARLRRKPHLHVAAASNANFASALTKWMKQNGVRVLNIAGSRTSQEPEVGQFVRSVLEEGLRSYAQTGRR
jgi:hypothetical protein